MGKNTSYRTKIDDITDAELATCNIENGALVRTPTGLYMGHSGSNVKVYPNSGNSAVDLGWARYDDSLYTSSNKLSLSRDTQVVFPNNGNAIIKSDDTINFYNSSTKKILGVNENDVYMLSVSFKASAQNATQTYLEYELEGSGIITSVSGTITFPKGNNVEHGENIVMQYYTDSTFVENGSQLKIEAKGHNNGAKIWDIQYFIQRTQNGG